MEFMEVIRKRRSIRKYKPDPVPDELVEKVLEATRLIPSGKNMQPQHFVVVRDPETKRRMQLRPQTEEAPIIVVGLIDPTMGRCSPSDGIIAFEHLILAAVNYGLGACWKGTYLGHLEEHAEAIKEALGVPEHMEVVAYTPLGYPNEDPEPRDKKSLAEMVHYEKFRA